jgi:hypothetical protein
MNSFVQRHCSHVIGMLSGFDRLRLRGTLRLLAHAGGMFHFLWRVQVLLKDFKEYVTQATNEVRRATERTAQGAGRPMIYLRSSGEDKEAVARGIARSDRVEQGLICVISCLEPCYSYRAAGNRETKELELRREPMKCLHQYYYYQHPQLGFLHVRLQTWFPFTMHICLNGREWLARQLDQAGIGYKRRDNCFVDLGDLPRAQRLFDRQLNTNWARLLDELADAVHPTRKKLMGDCPSDYYWSADESEWASDVMFRSSRELGQLYPHLIRHAMTSLGSREVMRFLGRKVPAGGGIYNHFQGEVMTDLRQRPEGMRIKHRLNRNSIKMYDKQGSVLRVETTINDARDMKVYRPKEGDEGGQKDWRYLRKGIADLHRRAQISQAANERYLESLASVEDPTPLAGLIEPLCRRTRWKGQPVRALNPLSSDDATLLEAVSRGEFAINGFRNRDLRPLLYPKPIAELEERRKRSAAITRKLRLLRAHGLIRKVPKTHRYVLTERGAPTIAALLAARQANTKSLLIAA